jgi:hypothetical protein
MRIESTTPFPGLSTNNEEKMFTGSSSFKTDADVVDFFGAAIGGSGAGFPNSSIPLFRSSLGRFRPFFRIGPSWDQILKTFLFSLQ